MTPRASLVALGPVIAAATVLVALRTSGAPAAPALALAALAAGGLARSGLRGGDVSLAVGLGAVGVAAGITLIGDGSAPEVVLWAAGAVAAGEATGLARRTRSTAVPDAAVRGAELTWSAGVVAATVVGGLALLGVAGLPGPDGLVGEVIALGAVVALGALVATTPAGRAALRSLLPRRAER
ncbi:MAG TPA: hypothetical protein VFU19_16550 [Iamia sp.]|nr:hypothetical protein [Iamia sp.]